jgi:hypothetical protein
MMGKIDVDAIDRMIAGAEARVEIWRRIDENLKADGKLTGLDHSSGFAFHTGTLRILKQVKDMIH